MDKVRVGMVGTSWYADSMHLPSLTSHPQASVTAICGRNAARAAEMAAKFGVPHVFTDWRAMFQSGLMDAVVIAAPDDLHYPMCMAAIDAGLHVVCEKPLALTAAEARTMAAAADAAGVKHMTFFTLRWFPHTRFLRELVDAGRVGQPTHCQIAYFHGNGRDGRYRWRLDGDRANGILGDLGSHLIDLARWLNGDIVRVAAHLGAYGPRTHPDGRPVTPANDAALLTLEFANGSQGIIHASAVIHTGGRGMEQHVRFYGDAGSVEADFAFGNFGNAGVSTAVRAAGAPDGLYADLPIPDHILGGLAPEAFADAFNSQPAGDRYFIDCLLAGRQPTPSLWDGVIVQEVIEAAITSHREGRWVTVPPVSG